MTATKKPSLFDLAKKAAPKAAASKEKDKVVIDGYSDTLIRLRAAREEMKNLEAEIKLLEGQVKEVAQEKFLDLYIEQKKRPESFKIAGDAGGEMLVIVQDRYGKVDESKAELLDKEFPDVVGTKRTYTFNEEILTKHEDAITNAILSMEIPDEDKAALLTVSDETFVRKGTIERLVQYDKPRELYSIISPILMLK